LIFNVTTDTKKVKKKNIGNLKIHIKKNKKLNKRKNLVFIIFYWYFIIIMKFELKWLAWEITRRCNLKCVHCRSSSEMEVSQHPDFSKEFGFNLLDQIAEFDTKPVVVLSGGEPLLREDWHDFACYGTEKGLRMCLATNGTLVNNEICQKIKDAGIKMVSLSLDGADAGVHDNFRNQPGAFDGTINAAKLFKENDIKFLINSSFTKRNQQEIPKVWKLAKELGATAWYMFMIVPTGRGEDIMDELISAEDYEELLKWHYQMEKEEDEILVRPTCAPHYYRIKTQVAKEEGERIQHRTLQFSTGGAKGCLAGQLILLVNVDGEALPCSYFPLSAGNLHEQNLKDIWENSALLKELRDFKGYKGKCGNCEYLNICGGCRARAYAMTGDYLDEEPFCNYVPIKMSRKK
jgi:heme b synthase